MSDHLLMTKLEFLKAEDYVFGNIIEQGANFLKGLNVPAVTIDSSAIRAHTMKCRWMGDIDFFLFHPEPPRVLEALRSTFGSILVANPDGFFRVPFDVPATYAGIPGVRFLLDFHVNAIYFRGEPFSDLTADDLASASWRSVRSADGFRCVSLPIPSASVISRLKSRRSIGRDAVDLFVLFAYSAESLHLATTKVWPQLNAIGRDLDRICAEFELAYFEPSTEARKRFEAVLRKGTCS